ncbi:MAG: glycerol-3-phosphate acyltransferase [Erysipelotrichia bacterium]|nr:glycerol-3-phosphate acyltransferase [Erysipelotrichia bacterium]
MNYIIALLLGYGLGCINPAYFFAKAKGFDIRTRGTMSAGASNAKTTMGWKYGIFCALYDALKSVLAMFIIQKLFPGSNDATILAGCSAVIGHIFPFYLNFKGGKGFAAYIGMVFAINWKLGLILLAIGAILSLLTNWVVMATLTFILSFPIYNIVTHAQPITIISSVIVSLVILYKHIINFRRLLNKEEIGINGKHVGIKLKKQ